MFGFNWKFIFNKDLTYIVCRDDHYLRTPKFANRNSWKLWLFITVLGVAAVKLHSTWWTLNTLPNRVNNSPLSHFVSPFLPLLWNCFLSAKYFQESYIFLILWSSRLISDSFEYGRGAAAAKLHSIWWTLTTLLDSIRFSRIYGRGGYKTPSSLSRLANSCCSRGS